MAIYTSQNATCVVRTYKEGLLSSVAHDLKLRVGNFQIEVNDPQNLVEAVFHSDSIEVVCAMRGATENPTALSGKDRAEIQMNLQREVLRVERHPQIRFRSTTITRREGEADVLGDLTLVGVTKRLRMNARLVDGTWTLKTTLRQSDFGITPFRAMLGTLRIKDDVEIELGVPQS